MRFIVDASTGQGVVRYLRSIMIEQNGTSEEWIDTSAFDYDAWLRKVEAVRQQIRMHHGGNLPSMDVVGLLRDIRDGDDE